MIAPGSGLSTALVLAGSRGGTDPVAAYEGVVHKALVQIGGETMLSRVIAALRAAGLQRVLVSTNIPEVAAAALELGAEVVDTASGPSESVSRAFDLTGAPLLVTTADHALLAPDWVAHFVRDTPLAADVSIMLARQQDVEAILPESRRTWLRFADGGWSGCNLFLLATPAASRVLDSWRSVEAERKNPLRLALRLGWSTLFDFLLGRLNMAEAVVRLGHRMGVSAAMVPATNGLAAVDVDKVDDLILVRRVIEAR